MKFTEKILNGMSEESRANVTRVMEKYEDNRWWESDDPLHIAKYQLFEPIFMSGEFSMFHEGCEKLLDRPVYSHEFGNNTDELKFQARIALHRREVGSDFTTITPAQRDKQVAAGMSALYKRWSN